MATSDCEFLFSPVLSNNQNNYTNFNLVFKLQNFLELSEYGTGKPVFEDVLNLLRHLHNELVEKIVSNIIAIVHQKLIAFANLK